jgi:hypothetical protein
MVEAMRRERNEKVSFVRAIGGIVGKGLGLKRDEILPYVQDYAEEVFQLKYNYKYQKAEAQRIVEKLTQQSEDQRLLAKVARMTVED